MDKTICPICCQELDRMLRSDFLLCPDCQVAVRVSGTLAKEPDRLNVYSEQWVEEHSQNPIAKDIAAHTAQVVGSVFPNGSKILDIGCGSGLLVDQLAKMGYQAYGSDWSKPAVEFAQKNMKGTFIYSCVEDNELVGNVHGIGRFDLVIASHILEHLEAPSSFLEWVSSLLKPDGYLVIAVPNLDWWNPKSVYRSVSTIFDPEHVVGYSPKGMRKLLDVNGYEVVDMLTRTHRLAILTAIGITVYRALKLFRGERISAVKTGYVKATGEGALAKVLAWGMTPWNRLSERGLKGMELIVVARKIC